MRSKEERKALHTKQLKPSVKSHTDKVNTSGGEQIVKEKGVWYKVTHVGNKKMYLKLSDTKE